MENRFDISNPYPATTCSSTTYPLNAVNPTQALSVLINNISNQSVNNQNSALLGLSSLQEPLISTVRNQQPEEADFNSSYPFEGIESSFPVLDSSVEIFNLLRTKQCQKGEDLEI